MQKASQQIFNYKQYFSEKITKQLNDSTRQRKQQSNVIEGDRKDSNKVASVNTTQVQQQKKGIKQGTDPGGDSEAEAIVHAFIHSL
jgi:hypothetical protein